jgi:predicted Zn-ribbon and HTH transcriptional regulator
MYCPFCYSKNIEHVKYELKIIKHEDDKIAPFRMDFRNRTKNICRNCGLEFHKRDLK